ncbi:DUF6978 family protein [Vagococcus entomophilus]|uniref:Uncharacterized protein n=1 Tax=Vagococcus entomophilus TaxID=1160095 RepID=A0A430AKP8_9ENTE|nr:hypothetical protein [Vagococcus entomophilus]RSU08477.1 hypothetical protein CBF30_04355 [Vagococcus entomophilus]
MELLLNDSEAHRLIKIFKTTLEKHNVAISYGDSGEIKLKSFEGKREFILRYRFSEAKTIFHFQDLETNHTLFRVTLSASFHKNSDNVKIYGNRINVFDESEFYAKNDGTTHCKCHSLPYEGISDSDDFLTIFDQVCIYASIEKQGNINISIANQQTLF